MIDVELLGGELLAEGLTAGEVRRLCALCAARMGLRSAHVAVELVSGSRIAELNSAHRGQPEPTDVLSFPIDGAEPIAGPSSEDREAPRELGDIFICPEHTADLREAVVHGMLHLLGMDHERDDGEMLALQGELLALARP
jgi:probable rRNA maturation factor